jgi:phasin family protein
MSNNKNPFFSLFNTWAEQNPLLANAGFDKYIVSAQSNAKAFSEIVKATSDNLQALSSRQIKIAQKNAEELSRFIQDVTFSTKNVEEKITKHADFVKSSFDSAINHSSEMIEAATKFGTDTGELINKKTSEAFSELAKNSPSTKKEKQAA